MEIDATFWAMIALFLFIGVVVYFKVPAMLTRSLDERAAKIRGELDEARRLREEAQGLLSEYQSRRRQAENEAAGLVAAAQREAAGLVAEARQKSQDYVARRTALAEQKIAQAERDAITEVRATAVDVAVEAARRLLAGKSDSDAAAFQTALGEVKARMH